MQLLVRATAIEISNQFVDLMESRTITTVCSKLLLAKISKEKKLPKLQLADAERVIKFTHTHTHIHTHTHTHTHIHTHTLTHTHTRTHKSLFNGKRMAPMIQLKTNSRI